jgi:hypothetical protein
MASPERRHRRKKRGLFPLSRRAKFWGAAGLVLTAGAALWWVVSPTAPGKEKWVAKGRPVCPPSPAPTAGLRAGDYVILVLGDRSGTFEELVWGQVLSRSPEGDAFLVRLLGLTGESGAVAISKEKHGFRVGELLQIDADCIWDTMAQPDTGGKGQLFCGFAGEDLLDKAPVHVPDLQRGDEVMVVASTLIGSDAHADPLWVKVDGFSRTQNVVYGTIISQVQFPITDLRSGRRSVRARLHLRRGRP